MITWNQLENSKKMLIKECYVNTKRHKILNTDFEITVKF